MTFNCEIKGFFLYFMRVYFLLNIRLKRGKSRLRDPRSQNFPGENATGPPNYARTPTCLDAPVRTFARSAPEFIHCDFFAEMEIGIII